MKKIFWCSVAVAVTAASCVYLASRHVERVPLGVVGQALVNMGGEESSNSGTGGRVAPRRITVASESSMTGLPDPASRSRADSNRSRSSSASGR